MSIDVDPDCPCTVPDHIISRSRVERGLLLSRKEFEKYRAKVLSEPLPPATLIEKIKFYSNKEVIRLKYKLFMWYLEEKIPPIYNLLIFLGLPKPYEPYRNREVCE